MSAPAVSPNELAARIDHTLLAADATGARIRQLCDEAIHYSFASVCVNSRWVPLAADCLGDSTPVVCCVIAFPLGAMASDIKAAEAAWAFEAGAAELDVVMDVAAIKAGEDALASADLRQVVAAAPDAIIKAILETGLLAEEEIARACAVARDAGAHFVKTSTGFGPRGASLEDVRLMRSIVGSSMGVKASGGIRDRDTAVAMLEAGADRLGSSAGVRIVDTQVEA